MYGVTVSPSSTSGRIGAPGKASGGTGWTSATTLTLNVFLPQIIPVYWWLRTLRR
jgi:hypothetical protein